MARSFILWLPVAAALLAAACSSGGSDTSTVKKDSVTQSTQGQVPADRDIHSYARPWEARVTHVALELTADFAAKTLGGTATLNVERTGGARELVLDTRGLAIAGAKAQDGRTLTFTLGAVDRILGQPLT